MESNKHTNNYTRWDIHSFALKGDADSLRIALSISDNSMNWFKGEREEGYYNSNILALHQAAENGHLECVEILLDFGADINCMTSYTRETPLHLAAREGHKSVVAILIDRGADINMNSRDKDFNMDWYGKAIALAAYYNHKDIVKILFETGNMDIDDLQEAMAAAACHDSLDCIDFLLDVGVGVNSKTYGLTPLQRAAMSNHLESAKRLILRGANVNSKDGKKFTPLIEATQYGHIEMCRLLLDNKADIHKVIYRYKPRDGCTDCRPMIIAEIEHRRKRAAFDSFIAHHIENPLYKNSIYSTCYPVGNMLRAQPAVGWPRAEQVRDKYYFDEMFFYLHLYAGKIVTNTTSERYSSIITLARDSDATSTLMTVLTDRLKMYLKPATL